MLPEYRLLLERILADTAALPGALSVGHPRTFDPPAETATATRQRVAYALHICPPAPVESRGGQREVEIAKLQMQPVI